LSRCVGASPRNGGAARLPPEAPAALRRWRDLIPDAPPQATLTGWTGTPAYSPFLPRELDHQPLVSVGYVWVGDPDEGRRLLPAFRGIGSPIAERIQPLTYLQLQTIDDTPQGHHHRRYWKGHYLREFGDEAIDAFI
jgi:hypothetical protein